MKTTLLTLLLTCALNAAAQDTLITKLPPYDGRWLPAGEALKTSATHRQVSLACLLAAGFVAGATASNQARGTFTDRQAGGWYTVAGLLGAVSIGFQISSNGKLRYAGSIMATDWNHEFAY